MKKNNKKLKLFSLIFLILFSLYFQTVVYSAISSKLMITGDAVARIRSNVRINKFRIHEVSNGVISSYEEFSKTYTMSNVTLPNNDSYIIYELVIGNYEDVEMQLSSIKGLPSNLTYELIDYSLHDMICDNTNKCFGGVEKKLYLKIKYANYNASGTNYNINLEYEFKEFSNTLMIGTSFRDTIPSNATHLVFTDEKPSNGVTLIDVSLEQDMGVVGYLDGTTYKVSTRRTGEMPEANADSSYMFNGKALTNIDLDNLDITVTTNIEGLFKDCTSLTNINFGSDWDTSNITSAKYTFENCSSLTTIDLSGFNTTKIKSFAGFFKGCSSLISLDVSKLGTSNSTNFSQMFRDCHLLEVIDVSNFKTGKATSLQEMFFNCYSVQNLDVSSWDTSSNKSLFGIFTRCKSLVTLDLSGWDVSSVTIGYWMFQSAENLKEVNMAGWNFKNDVSISGMFCDAISLEYVNLSGWNTKLINSSSSMFAQCRKLKVIDLSSWDTSNIYSMKEMFKNCTELEKIYVGDGWDTSSVTSSDNMFYNCFKFPNYDANYVDVSKAYVGDGGYLSYPPKTFNIDGVAYKYEEGMTWRDWVDSIYDTRGFVNNNDLIYTDDLMYTLVYEEDNGSYTSYSWPYIDDLIDPNLVYVTFYEAGEDGEW